jgi:hypothetical protein
MDGQFSTDLPHFQPVSKEPEKQLEEIRVYLGRLNTAIEEMLVRLYRKIPNP